MSTPHPIKTYYRLFTTVYLQNRHTHYLATIDISSGAI